MVNLKNGHNTFLTVLEDSFVNDVLVSHLKKRKCVPWMDSAVLCCREMHLILMGVPLGLVIGIDDLCIVYSGSIDMLQGYGRTTWVCLQFIFSYNIAGDFAT